MPKKPINYENTIFYKIVCNDLDVLDFYVGSTTNWSNRLQQHKRGGRVQIDWKLNYMKGS